MNRKNVLMLLGLLMLAPSPPAGALVLNDDYRLVVRQAGKQGKPIYIEVSKHG